MQQSLLLVDDNEGNRITLAALLEDEGFSVEQAASLAEGRTKLGAGRYAAVLLDLHLGDGLGLELVPEIRARSPQTKVIIVSGTGVDDAAGDADLVLDKDGDFEKLLDGLRSLIA